MEGTNVSKSTNQQVVVSTIKGQGDPGYWLTSRKYLLTIAGKGLIKLFWTSGMLVESALSLTLSHDRLPALAQQGGVLTPAAAFGDVIVERLNATDEFEIESMTLQEWTRRRESKKSV